VKAAQREAAKGELFKKHLLDGAMKQSPPYLIGAEFTLVLLVGTTMTLVLPLLTPLRAMLFNALVLRP
jgi:hypothetical protein